MVDQYNKATPTTATMISLHHTSNPQPNQCTSTLVQSVKAPLPLVWSILRRFDQPDVYEKFVKKCTMLAGSGGAGSVREVAFVSGLPGKVSLERLDLLDDDMHVMIYDVIEGDHRLENYRSTNTVHEEEDGGEAVVVTSYVVDVPKGKSGEETCIFVNTLLGCNLRSSAKIAEKLACKV